MIIHRIMKRECDMDERGAAGASVPGTTRRLLFAGAVTGAGSGVWFTVWALYLTRVVGIPPGRMGAALLVAGVAGLLLALPAGVLADRYGARRVLVVLYVVRAGAASSYLLVADPPALILSAAVLGGAEIAALGTSTALVAGLYESRARIRTLARMRAVQHAAYTVGAGAGALVLTLDSPALYRAAIAAKAVTLMISALALRGVPDPAGTAPDRNPRPGRAFTDVPFAAAMSTSALLASCWAILSTGLPLWITGHTSAPPATSAALVVLSCVLIAALQTTVSGRVTDVSRAARAVRSAGMLLAVSCLVVLAAAGRPAWWAVAVVAVAGLVHVAGELLYVAGDWQLSLSLMAEDARGEYQGVRASLTGVVQTLAPPLVALLVGGAGGAGWVLLAAILLAGSAPAPALARWAQRTRRSGSYP
jgi:hypothetical protein